LCARVDFTAAMELGVTNSGGATTVTGEFGVRVSGTLSLRALGRRVCLGVHCAANADRLDTARDRTAPFMNVGLEAADVETVPGLPNRSGPRLLRSHSSSANGNVNGNGGSTLTNPHTHAHTSAPSAT